MFHRLSPGTIKCTVGKTTVVGVGVTRGGAFGVDVGVLVLGIVVTVNVGVVVAVPTTSVAVGTTIVVVGVRSFVGSIIPGVSVAGETITGTLLNTAKARQQLIRATNINIGNHCIRFDAGTSSLLTYFISSINHLTPWVKFPHQLKILFRLNTLNSIPLPLNGLRLLSPAYIYLCAV